MDRRYRMRGRVVLRHVGNEVLLVPVSGPNAASRVFPLNATARTIWECLAAGGTISETVRRLVEDYRVDAETARQDAAECARVFVDHELLEEISE